MARHKYTIASEDGAMYARLLTSKPELQEGDDVTLDLTADARRAVVAAGWLEPTDKNGGDA